MRLPLLLLALTCAQPALAADPDAERGRELALRWCASCHVVDADAPGGDAGPAFATLVNRLGRTEEELRVWLSDPHPPMPEMNLSGVEIDDILAHILSLKR